MKTLTIVFFCYLPLLTLADSASNTDTVRLANAELVAPSDVASIPPSRSEAPASELKIVSLAPHLTEWAFSLGLGSNLVGVSDYSDYPEAAKSIERVADFQGADIAAIVALEPDLILAWEGGNKPQDIHKLASMGLHVFKSKVEKISDIASEIKRLGALTNTQKQATQLTNNFLDDLNALKREYDSRPLKPVFYYSWTAPLMTIGPNAWGNKLLNICGAQTLFSDSPVDYPQVSIKEVLIRQPHALIAASKSSRQELDIFWREHRNFLDAPLVVVNPDVTSRFSLRLINELKSLCEGIK
ncbi:helical backbone metal receptor [Alteromonas portus]|uniref:helical backbone metal receptor n=1 Tax=Alteromonas portus TaxID=2565549 RepID=UPI003BF8968F